MSSSKSQLQMALAAESGHDAQMALADHAAWFEHRAAREGGLVRHLEGVLLAASAASQSVDLVVEPAADPRDAGQLLDRGLHVAVEQGPGVAVGCWSADVDLSRGLLGVILGRGLSWGWQPRWMNIHPTGRLEVDLPAGVTIVPADQTSLVTLDDVPYASGLPSGDSRHSRQGCFDRIDVRCFVACAGDNIAAGVTLCIHEVAGSVRASVHDLGVSPQWRRKGLGRALTCFVLNTSFDSGVRSVALNATPEGAFLYSSMGFSDLGMGQTWWLADSARSLVPTSVQERELVKAIALDDRDVLTSIPQSVFQRGEQELTCQLTAMQLAARCQSTMAARVLQERGVQLDLLSASRLGFRDDVESMITALGPNLDLVDERTGTTLLHDAVREQDVWLAGALLAAGASTDVKDCHYHMTAAQWLAYVDCPELNNTFRKAGHDL